MWTPAQGAVVGGADHVADDASEDLDVDASVHGDELVGDDSLLRECAATSHPCRV